MSVYTDFWEDAVQTCPESLFRKFLSNLFTYFSSAKHHSPSLTRVQLQSRGSEEDCSLLQEFHRKCNRFSSEVNFLKPFWQEKNVWTKGKKESFTRHFLFTLINCQFRSPQFNTSFVLRSGSLVSMHAHLLGAHKNWQNVHGGFGDFLKAISRGKLQRKGLKSVI